MPALETTFRHANEPRPALGHVTQKPDALMADTFIDNASSDDLRSICCNLLASGPPGIAPC
ncbi:hypothetical protein HYPSUDRAFT_210452 [Hypholoma sublateritium FD-334 SS-4]|uniref:Uncharacterized protein n=1 Tax=Hypholoma sublateritium (strain FD-334 SS-4) TaxID=945553 RepID=A0A0D2N6S2_HYPSF|nr:hypothetical protein HYPSUDRAFT_210452 [Hypholoma sublateritium FD-334 SS-4]